MTEPKRSPMLKCSVCGKVHLHEDKSPLFCQDGDGGILLPHWPIRVLVSEAFAVNISDAMS